MRSSIKQSYQEFIDYIEFPTAIYIYETGNVIALNEYAKNILGYNCKNINLIWKDQVKQKYKRKLLNNGSEILYNKVIDINGEKKMIDIEVNSIILEKYHILFCFFEQSEKHYFTEHLKNQVPRLMWKDESLKYLGANAYGLRDLNLKEELLYSLDNKDLFDDELSNKLTDDDKSIVRNRSNIYNVMEELKVDGREPFFIKLHRMPIINYLDQVFGVVYVYSLILNQEEKKNLIQDTLKENVILKEVVSKSSTIIVRWNTDIDWTIDYISSNINNYGYDSIDFYSKKISWRNIIHPDDCERVYNEYQIHNEKMLLEDNTLTLEYRIITSNNEIKWVREEAIVLRESFNNSYREGVVNDITPEKELEKELVDNRNVFQIRIDDFLTSNKTFDSVDFWSLLDIKNINLLLETVEKLSNIWGFLIDNKANILSRVACKKSISEDIYKVISNIKYTRYLKEITKECMESMQPVTRNYLKEAIVVTGIPFALGEKYIGTWFLFASIRSVKEYYPLLKKENMECLIDIKLVSRKNYDNIVQYLSSYVKFLCNTILTKLELIEEKKNIKETSIRLERQLEKSKIITKLLKLSHLERPYQEVLNNIFNKVAAFSEIDHISIYESIEESKELKTLYEWDINIGIATNNENTQLLKKLSYVFKKLEDKGGFFELYVNDDEMEYKDLFSGDVKAVAISHITLNEYNDTIIIIKNSKENRKWKDVERGLFREITPIIQNVIVKARALEVINHSNITLEKVLNHLDNYILVLSASENQILFVNSMVAKVYSKDVIGSTYSMFCADNRIEVYDNLGEGSVCKVMKEGKYKCYDFNHKRHLSLHSRKIQWIDGQDAYVISIQDISSISDNLKKEYGYII